LIGGNCGHTLRLSKATELTMKKLVITCSLMLAISGCATQPLSEYTPVVDPAKTKPQKFEADLTDCRAIALKVEADYKERQKQEMGTQIIVGLIVGAALGAAIGDSDYALAGAAYGAAAGAATPGDYTHDLVKYGPRRVVDRCMTERGHAILNDIGKG
jgi:outer membrane lipoprotein SlyB